MTVDKEGKYCTICGGIPPSEIRIRRILIDGKETGIDKLDWILEGVAKIRPGTDDAIREELLKRVREFNYVPSKKADTYGEALLREYRAFCDKRVKAGEQGSGQ